MRVLILIGLFASIFWGAGQINVVVSVAPQVYFVKKIAKDDVVVSVMVPDGRSPETYEPLPSQIKQIKDAKLYIGVGMEFEKIWRDRFKGANATLKFIDLSEVLRKNNSLEKQDPHIWLSLKLAKIQAKEIYHVLTDLNPSRSGIYKQNLDEFLQELDSLDSQIKNIFDKPNAQRSFVVYHPAFGYLAREYNLDQIALEHDGKAPKPKQLIALQKEILAKHISVVYIQPEFSKKRIQALASDLKLRVLELDPLRKDWADNMLHIARMIASEGKQN